eukprot:11256412-Ditylum_brightwellii.AAC.1
MARQNLLLQQHLVDLHCVNAIPKKLLIIHLPQVEIAIDDGSDTKKEWITSTTLDAGRKTATS